MSEYTLVDLLRHGEPQGGKRYRGQIDDPLSDAGWAQMWAAVGDAAPWQQIRTSPLARCQAFAAALAERHQLPLSVDARLMEIGFGAWEGQTAEQLRARDPDQLRRFYHDPVTQRPPGAEPLAAFQARVIEGFQQLAADFAGQRILVVCHAGVIRALLAHILDAPAAAIYRIDVGYAAMTQIRLCAERPPSLVRHGVTRLDECP